MPEERDRSLTGSLIGIAGAIMQMPESTARKTFAALGGRHMAIKILGMAVKQLKDHEAEQTAKVNPSA